MLDTTFFNFFAFFEMDFFVIAFFVIAKYRNVRYNKLTQIGNDKTGEDFEWR